MVRRALPRPGKAASRDPETLDPFPGAFAKAVAQMPVLEFFMLTSGLQGETEKLLISYHAPGQRAEWGDEEAEDEKHRRIYYACEVWKSDTWDVSTIICNRSHSTDSVTKSSTDIPLE